MRVLPESCRSTGSRILRASTLFIVWVLVVPVLGAQSGTASGAQSGLPKTALSVSTPPALVLSRNEKAIPLGVELSADTFEVEAGKTLRLSARATLTRGQIPLFLWKASSGTIAPGPVLGEVEFVAPPAAGPVVIEVSVSAPNHKTETRSLNINVVPVGALKRTALVRIEVDTATLKKVWVSAARPAENFKGPLKIKGTFRYDPATGDAFAGGSWPVYDMRDDGKNGDRTANDGIWTIQFNFEKSDSKVYFAFDDTNEFRVEFESGLAWRLKMAWLNQDEFKDDFSNPAFIPSQDQVLVWDQKMADAARIYSPAK